MTSTKHLAVQQIRIADITVTEGRKRRVKHDLHELADSIRELGLLNPIILTADLRLVAGLHRLRACESLGWTEIPAITLGLSDLDVELAEIDENLCRVELTLLERVEQTARRKVVYEARHPETTRGKTGALASNQKQGRIVATATDAVATQPFVTETAARSGRSPRVVRLYAQIGEGLDPAVCDTIRDTPLAGKLGELLKLSRIAEPAEQAAAAARIIEGQAATVAEAVKQVAAGSPAPEAEVVCDELGQEITDPEVAEAYTLLRTRTLEVVRIARAARRAWGHFHDEQEQAERLRILCGRGYSFLRERVEEELKQLTFNIGSGAPYALCPYCKGKPLAKDRRDWCEGCRGGGWVDKSTYDAAPPELQVQSGEGPVPSQAEGVSPD